MSTTLSKGRSHLYFSKSCSSFSSVPFPEALLVFTFAPVFCLLSHFYLKMRPFPPAFFPCRFMEMSVLQYNNAELFRVRLFSLIPQFSQTPPMLSFSCRLWLVRSCWRLPCKGVWLATVWLFSTLSSLPFNLAEGLKVYRKWQLAFDKSADQTHSPPYVSVSCSFPFPCKDPISWICGSH